MIHIIIVSVLVIVSTFLFGTFVKVENLLPVQASAQGEIIDSVFGIHIWLIAFFFSLIVVFMLYSIVVFRRRKGEQGSGAYMTGNQNLEIIWTVVPLAIVLYLAVIGATTLADVERRDPEAMVVDVFASQWNWRFEYEDGTSSDVLVLPKGKQTLLRLQSADVIHSFFVPEFRVKQDVLPGGEAFMRELRITPTLEGDFKVRCAEICGQLHYSMLADVQVVSANEFDIWLSSQSACELSAEECGQLAAQQFGCLACHTVDGSVVVGPSWQGIAGTEKTLEDGSTVIVDADYLFKSIIDPDAQVVAGYPASVMPQNFAEILSEEQIQQITAFILSLE
jgi:cytochrome c oxidase subunit 2